MVGSKRRSPSGKIWKPISVPGTYTKKPREAQGFLEILQAPVKGIQGSIEIILFVLISGGFMFVFNQTGAMLKGVRSLAYSMKGKEHWLIAIFTSIFSFFGASYGMAEETFIFYPILVPLFLAAGYDLLVPLAVIFGGANIGGIASFSNPFSTIIASDSAGVDWNDGLPARVALWAIITTCLVIYT
ncbi:MAG: YfcC family protein, partial [Hymenobacter sp.]